MIRNKILTFPAMLLFALMAVSCSSDDDLMPEAETVSTTFRLGLDPQSRAAQNLNLQNYDAKIYLYEGKKNDDGTMSYSPVKEMILTDNSVTIEDLTVKNQYKAVFLAIPKGQTPGLPNYTLSGINPTYDEASVPYINEGMNMTDNNIFRSVVSFTASTNASVQSTILTRQNGAVEVRIVNTPGIKSASLHVDGYTEMLLNDGTGGQVIATGKIQALSKDKEDGFEASDVRIRINLLPVEDITDADGSKNYLELTMTDGSTRKYPLKSDQSQIPIYPNQVTWLTIGNGYGNFDVSFSGNINVDDNEWDGWKVVVNNEAL